MSEESPRKSHQVEVKRRITHSPSRIAVPGLIQGHFRSPGGQPGKVSWSPVSASSRIVKYHEHQG